MTSPLAVAFVLGLGILILTAIAYVGTAVRLGSASLWTYAYGGAPVVELGLVAFLGTRASQGLRAATIAAWCLNAINFVVAAFGALGNM